MWGHCFCNKIIFLILSLRFLMGVYLYRKLKENSYVPLGLAFPMAQYIFSWNDHNPNGRLHEPHLKCVNNNHVYIAILFKKENCYIINLSNVIKWQLSCFNSYSQLCKRWQGSIVPSSPSFLIWFQIRFEVRFPNHTAKGKQNSFVCTCAS